MTWANRLSTRWRSLTGQKRAAQRAAMVAFDAACSRLGPGDLALDLGANAGLFTTRLADTGADVIAFEPDPHAFDRLSNAVAGMANVTLKQAAAGAEAGTLPLYRRSDFGADPDRHSTSSSLLAEKRNMSAEGALEVEVVDLTSFLTALDRDVAVMKVDIEGAEVALMERLLDAPVSRRIRDIFVETHERVVPALAARTTALKARTAGQTAPRINWDWH